MAIDSNVLQEVVDALKQDPEIKNNVYQATVSRIDGEGVVWVNIAGSDTETPTAITSAEVAPGDAVNVEWRNNKLYIGGNYSNPSAGVVRVSNVEQIADVAVANASRAQTAAANAESAAENALASASTAKTAAETAQTAADTALVNLATTEDVVGVLNWITAHGTMVSQYGEVFDPDKVYFIADPTGDYVVSGTHYSVVPSPVAEDIDSYYILNISESVQNYVATHLAVDSEGLWIIPDAGGNKVLIAVGGAGHTYETAGTYIVGKVNGVDTVLAEFTASGARIGKNDGGNVSIDNNSVDINDGASQLATFGADGAQIGKDDENRLIITPIELLQKNSDGAVFFNVNTNNGTKTISVTLSGDSGSQNTTIASSGSYSKTSEISIPSDLSPGTTVELSAMTGKLKPQYTGSEMVGWSFTFQNSTFNSTYREPSDAFINSNTLACFDVPSSSISVGTDLTNSYSCDFTVKYSGSTTIGLYHVSCVVSYSSANNKITSTWTVDNNFSESRTISFQWSSLQGIFSYSTTVPYYVMGTSADAAVGAFSIVGGQSVYATSDNQSAFGKFNVQDSNNDYAFIIGNGSDSANRSNALTVDWSGNVMAQGMAGMIQMFAGSTAPTGWLMCDGSAVSRTTYAKLFSVIGTTYGTGDGSTTFNLPDLRGRMPLGSSSSHSLASTGGSEYIQAHTHANTIKAKTPKFTHTISSSNSNVNLLGGGSEQSYGKAGGGGSTYPYKRLSVGDHAATDCTMSGSVGAVSGATTGNEGNMPPFLTINYIIATGKTA